MHLLLFFFIGVAIAEDAKLKPLALCWDKSLEYLNQAKSDIDGNYDKDPWYIKHKAQQKVCEDMRTDIKAKTGHKYIVCIPYEKDLHRCQAR